MNAAVGVTLNFDASTVAPSKPLDPIPSGWYKAVIEETKLEPTSKPGGQMLSIVLKVIEGEFAGRKLFDRLNLVNENPQAVQIAYETLSAIGHATGVVQCQNSQQYHNIPLAVKVKLQAAEVGKDGKNYDARNEVKGYDHVNSDHQFGPAAGGAPSIVGGVAGAPAGVPVWAAGAPAAAAAPPVATLAPPQAAAAPVPQHAPPVAAFQPPAAAQPWADPNAVAAPAPAAIPAQPFAAPAAPAPAAVAAQSGPVALPGAGGIPYESYRQQGWTDQMLHEHGKFAFPAPAAPVAPVAPAAPVAAPPPQAAAPAAPAPAAPAAGGPPPWATPQ